MNKRVFANIYVIVSVVIGIVFSLGAELVAFGTEMTAFEKNMVNLLNSLVMTGIPVVVFSARNKEDFRGFFAKIPLKQALNCLLVVPVLWSGGNYLNSLICASIARFGIMPIEQLPPSTELSAVISGFIFVCIVAPVLEELFYRGVILHLLKGYGTACAVVVSALLFALAHGSVTVLGVPLVYGLVFGYATVKYGSITPAIIMHMAANTLSWIFMTFEPAVVVMGVINIIMVILGAGGLIWATIKVLRKKELIVRMLREVWTYIKNPLWLPILANYIFTNFIYHG